MQPPQKAPITAAVGREVEMAKLANLLDQLIRAFQRTKVGLLEKIAAEAAFGKIWITIKAEIKATKGLTIKKWLAANPLPFGHQYANGCARLADDYDEHFMDDHNWFQQTGYEEGWRTSDYAGWEYGTQVIALRKRARAGEGPGRPAPVKQGRPSIKALRQERDDLEHEAGILLQGFEEVFSLYKQTQEGGDYFNPTLDAAKAAREQRDVAKHTEIPVAQTQIEIAPPAVDHSASVKTPPVKAGAPPKQEMSIKTRRTARTPKLRVVPDTGVPAKGAPTSSETKIIAPAEADDATGGPARAPSE